ncbi:MAG: hypothetical protein AMXMBFR13_35420 [Phycisphaerae bacterium]
MASQGIWLGKAWTARHPVVRVGLVAGFLTIATGCATDRVNLAQNGTVRMEVADCHPVILSAKAEQDGEETLVSGTVKRRPPLDLGRIHIDVTIVTPTGEVISETTALVYPRMIPIRRSRTSRFAVWFPFVPPKGSRVRLVCHSQPHEPSPKASASDLAR